MEPGCADATVRRVLARSGRRADSVQLRRELAIAAAQLRPNLARYLRKRSASLVEVRWLRETANSVRPASDRLLLARQTSTT